MLIGIGAHCGQEKSQRHSAWGRSRDSDDEGGRCGKEEGRRKKEEGRRTAESEKRERGKTDRETWRRSWTWMGWLDGAGGAMEEAEPELEARTHGVWTAALLLALALKCNCTCTYAHCCCIAHTYSQTTSPTPTLNVTSNFLHRLALQFSTIYFSILRLSSSSSGSAYISPSSSSSPLLTTRIYHVESDVSLTILRALSLVLLCALVCCDEQRPL